jgi:hypothetical protein
MNVYIVEVFNVPHDELKKLQDGDEATTPLVEIDWISTLQDEPKITPVEGALRQRYTPKSQDIISINDGMFKYSYWTNSMNNSLNFMLVPIMIMLIGQIFLRIKKRKHLCLNQLIACLKNLFPMMS